MPLQTRWKPLRGTKNVAGGGVGLRGCAECSARPRGMVAAASVWRRRRRRTWGPLSVRACAVCHVYSGGSVLARGVGKSDNVATLAVAQRLPSNPLEVGRGRVSVRGSECAALGRNRAAPVASRGMDAEDADTATMHAAADALRLRLQQAGVTSQVSTVDERGMELGMGAAPPGATMPRADPRPAAPHGSAPSHETIESASELARPCCTKCYRRPAAGGAAQVDTRGLHSSTFQLNLSALYGIGDARRGCVARVKGVLGDAGGCIGCVGCFLVPNTAQVELRSGRV